MKYKLIAVEFTSSAVLYYWYRWKLFLYKSCVLYNCTATAFTENVAISFSCKMFLGDIIKNIDSTVCEPGNDK